MRIDTKRLQLRDLVQDDFIEFVPFAAHPLIQRYMSVTLPTFDQAAKWFERALEANATKPMHHWVIIRHSDQKLVGWIVGGAYPKGQHPQVPVPMPSPRDEFQWARAHVEQIRRIKSQPGDVHGFGYAVAPTDWNQGYATEALRGIIDYSFSASNAKCLLGDHALKNLASGRVMQKAGLRHIAQDHVACYYRIDRDQWSPGTPPVQWISK